MAKKPKEWWLSQQFDVEGDLVAIKFKSSVKVAAKNIQHIMDDDETITWSTSEDGTVCGVIYYSEQDKDAAKEFIAEQLAEMWDE